MSDNAKRFGTFSGVFVTNVLTIFGVILFYREGWLVGNAGLLGAILIILIANSITLSTAFSISSIVTNIKIKGGGTYFIVSRSLGPEIGGAIGITLFFAQAFSIAFYIIGFTLSLNMFFPGVDIRILNIATLLIITMIAIFDASLAIKVQYIVLGLIMLAISSFLIGNLKFNIQPQFIGTFKDASFWKTFAIFFPAVTGIFAGVSLSGDLKDPAKNIPRGTIFSILFTLFFYIVIAVFFAYNVNVKDLITDKNIIYTSSKFPFIILLGIWSATISSALGSILGAPRTLQALATDGIVFSFFGKGSGKTNEPRRAMVLSVLMAGGLLMIGDMDFVAQLLTMFFLTSYGIVNLITFIDTVLKNPAYRPTFRVHWLISLFGTVSSFTMMFLINWQASIIAFLILIVIFLVLSHRNYEMNWGDLRKSFWASIIDYAVKNYEKYADHPRNWKPNLAVFENDLQNRKALLTFSSLITGQKGLVSYYIFRNSSVENISKSKNDESIINECTDKYKINHIYPKTILTNNDQHAHLITLQADGIASYLSNTILSDFSINDKNLHNHLIHLNSYYQLNKNVILLKNSEIHQNTQDIIDIWLSGFQANISLMLLIPFLITKNKAWSNTKIYIRMVVNNNIEKQKSLSNIMSILNLARMNIIPDIISLEDDNIANDFLPQQNIPTDNNIPHSQIITKIHNFFASNNENKKYDPKNRDKIINIIKQKSSDSRLVIMGLNIPEIGKENSYAESLTNIVKDLPTTFLIKSSKQVNLFK